MMFDLNLHFKEAAEYTLFSQYAKMLLLLYFTKRSLTFFNLKTIFDWYL